MFRIEAGTTRKYCDGFSRRSFLQIGVAGMGMASLAQILRAKEESAAQGLAKKDTSVILLWLDGGPGHMDLYDLKPDAPAEYAGIWRPTHTNVPGIDITELFPLQAKIADKFSIVRSLYHNNGGHFAGGHWMLTGRRGPGNANVSLSPSIGSMVTTTLGARKTGMPACRHTFRFRLPAASACGRDISARIFSDNNTIRSKPGPTQTRPISKSRTCSCRNR